MRHIKLEHQYNTNDGKRVLVVDSKWDGVEEKFIVCEGDECYEVDVYGRICNTRVSKGDIINE